MKEIIQTEQAPQAIGPYSQAVKVEWAGFRFRTDSDRSRKPGSLLPGGIAEQTEQVLKNLVAVLEAPAAA